jgi:hypothetical protein
MIKYSFPATLSARELYDLTNSPEITKMYDHYGENVEIAQYAVVEDEDANGEIHTKVAIRAIDGTLMATNSAPLVRDFENILNCLAQSGGKISVPHIISIDRRTARKSGRNFSGCTWLY